MASSYLKRTPSSAGSNTTATVSAWCKYHGGDFNTIVGGNEGSSSTDRSLFSISSDGEIYNQIVHSNTAYEQYSNRKLLDPAAWYHIVIQFDTSNGTQADRVKTYVNNQLITSWSTTASWPQNVPLKFWDTNNSPEFLIGARKSSSNYQYKFNGAMAHVHVIDGTVYAPSVFAETDSTSGIWIPKTAPSVTYGTNGGFYKFASGAIGTDSSGKSNNMTVVGNITSNKDSPDNNFITLNPLDNKYSAWSFSNCNNTVTMSNTNETYTTSTVGLSKGLWYWEVKITDKGANQTFEIGIASEPSRASGSQVWLGYHPNNYGLYASSGNVYNGNGASSASYGVSVDEGDIVGVYLDLDASKIYYAKNGAIMNSGTGLAITAVGSTVNGFYFPAIGKQSGASDTKIFDFNFGNGYFGTTAISGAVADAGGEGQFKYNPSTGTFDGSSKNFRAICTNNIATYG